MFENKAKKDLAKLISEVKSFLYCCEEGNKRIKLNTDEKIELALLYKKMEELEDKHSIGYKWGR